MRDLGGARSRGAAAPSRGRASHNKNADDSAGRHRRARRRSSWQGRRPATFERAAGAALGLKAHMKEPLHINAIVSPIPTKAYKPATVTPRQTSAMTLSGWSLLCLPGTALLLGYGPAHIDHAEGGEMFRLQGTKAYRRRNGNLTKFRPRSTSGARD